MEPTPWQRKLRFLTTGPPGKFPTVLPLEDAQHLTTSHHSQGQFCDLESRVQVFSGLDDHNSFLTGSCPPPSECELLVGRDFCLFFVSSEPRTVHGTELVFNKYLLNE